MDEIVTRLRRKIYQDTWYDGGYRPIIPLNPDGEEAADEIERLRAQVEELLGDAATLRGFINTHHMTPSMVHSLMMHWQRRANEAEETLAKTTDDLMRANRRVEARDRRISRLMAAFEDARKQGLMLPGDLEPPVVLSEEPDSIDPGLPNISRVPFPYWKNTVAEGRDWKACPVCGAPAGFDCRTIQGTIPPHEERFGKTEAPNHDL